MHISWLGQTCVKIQTKNQDQDALIVIDPYKPTTGNFPRSFSPNIVLFCGSSQNSATLSQDPFQIETLGEFELKNIVIYSLPAGQGNKAFKIVSEEMTIVHLGRLTENIANGEMEALLNPDILLIPAGGSPSYITRKIAANLATALEPRIIIPIGYQCDTAPNDKQLNVFISELGLKPENSDKKIIIKKKDLPAEETKLIILEKE
ncbi:MAG: hypothetical protein COU31_00035 [Candidatus Magasanikbacteria bacterium CG10_big_fil_rev_8_21_14_0_10_40_10]|uniref:Lactamase n=1 Tax=Candidatus Magasanikbacteria bacterium CG10_big_fil_rev_8_21_14_0_10_40_10 TaxID=1974648 RepID=A0A2M6W563_9BACT|nr:MAG: hypothetical protein COU31_00035 [Candidatus Magasanikbacteria bacterium CG10_big_fil_rev_8_21_14_0_10_40_10]